MNMGEKLVIKEKICAMACKIFSALFALALHPNKRVIVKSTSVSHTNSIPTASSHS